MIAAFSLLLAVNVADPRPALVQMQLAGRLRDALARVESELAEHPDLSHTLGLDFLRGHLLDQLDDPNHGAVESFAATLVDAPDLGYYSRYRLALDQDQAGHPEVAAGLVASVVRARPPALLDDAVRLFARSLAHGGDCRLLGGLQPETLPAPQRRVLALSQADCVLRAGAPELARGLLLALLQEDRTDDTARAAAERLAPLVSDRESGRVPLLLGLTFHQHREFERALLHLRMALGPGHALSQQDAQEARYIQARSQFWLERFAPAAILFGSLAHTSRRPEDRSRALYQQARSYELLGTAQWQLAAESFRLAYEAQPDGEWAAASLFAILRLEWRTGNEEVGPFYDLLTSRREWRDQGLRASLFLASSDLVRGRKDRARFWLDRVLPLTPAEQIEVAYWRGRLAELEHNPPAALAAYLTALRLDLYHPLSQSARARLGSELLSRPAMAEAKRLAASKRFEDLYSAWLLVGNSTETGRAAWKRARERLLSDPSTARWLRMTDIPVARWPLWQGTLRSPEERMLALGVVHEGAPAVRTYFPFTDPSLAFTGSRLLSKGGEVGRSVLNAEVMQNGAASRVPLIFLSKDFHLLLYPSAWWELLLPQTRLRGVETELVAAILREESHFDPRALSPAGARGLAQLTLPTARRIGAQIDMTNLDPDDLYRPEVSIALASTYVAQLLKELGGPHLAVAAYNAGEPQAALWKRYCFSEEPEEYFTKVTFQETRDYLRKVLVARAHYQELH
jgi:soluble lytic murein transglycosylase